MAFIQMSAKIVIQIFLLLVPPMISSELPPQLKSRFNGSLIHIQNPESTSLREKIITFYLNNFFHTCSAKEIYRIAKKTAYFDPRELERLICKAHLESLLIDSVNPTITAAQLEKVLQQMLKDKKILHPSTSNYKELALKGLKYTAIALGVVSTCYLIYLTFQKIKFLERKEQATNSMLDYFKTAVSGIKNEMANNNQITQKQIESLTKQNQTIDANFEQIKSNISNNKAVTDKTLEAIQKNLELLATNIDHVKEASKEQINAIKVEYSMIYKAFNQQIETLKKQGEMFDSQISYIKELISKLCNTVPGIATSAPK